MANENVLKLFTKQSYDEAKNLNLFFPCPNDLRAELDTC